MLMGSFSSRTSEVERFMDTTVSSFSSTTIERSLFLLLAWSCCLRDYIYWLSWLICYCCSCTVRVSSALLLLRPASFCCWSECMSCSTLEVRKRYLSSLTSKPLSLSFCSSQQTILTQMNWLSPSLFLSSSRCFCISASMMPSSCCPMSPSHSSSPTVVTCLASRSASTSFSSCLKVLPVSFMSSQTRVKRSSATRSRCSSLSFTSSFYSSVSIDYSSVVKRAGSRSSLKWERQNWQAFDFFMASSSLQFFSLNCTAWKVTKSRQVSEHQVARYSLTTFLPFLQRQLRQQEASREVSWSQQWPARGRVMVWLQRHSSSTKALQWFLVLMKKAMGTISRQLCGSSSSKAMIWRSSGSSVRTRSQVKLARAWSWARLSMIIWE